MTARISLLSGANLFEVSPSLIDVGDRIGFLHEDKAVALGRLMAVDGQRTAIMVRANPKNPEKPWKLVVGLHRTVGADKECMTLWALEVSGNPEDMKDLEASENLDRRTPAPIERAKFVAALVQAARDRLAREAGDLPQQKLAAKARWDRVRAGESRVEEALTAEVNDARTNFGRAYGWEESVREALGMSRSSIHNDLQLFRLLIEPFPELAEALSKHPVVGENASQLRAIAQVRDEADRRKVIEALLEDDELSAEMARASIGIDRPGGPAPTPERKAVNAIIGNLSRLTATAQKHHLDGIVQALKSDEVKRQLRDRLNAELGDDTTGITFAHKGASHDHVTPQQVVTALSETIGIVNRLLDGEGVEDEELERLRSQAQGVVFDIPEIIAPARGIAFEPGTLAHRFEAEGRL